MARKKKGVKTGTATAAIDDDVVTGPKTYTETDPIGAALDKGFTAREFTDAKVIAGEGEDMKTFNVNSAILSWRSEYFRNCFYGGFAETSEKILRKPNVSPKVMEVLLRFLYSGSIKLDDDAEFAAELVVAADELGITDGAKIISQDLVSRMTPDTSAEYLRNAYQRGLKALQESCLTHVLEHADNVLEDDEFMSLPAEAINDLVGHDKLGLDEEDVFKFMIKVAASRAHVTELDPKKWTPEQKGKIFTEIKPLLPFLRIYLLEADFVAETLEPLEFFDSNQFALIYKRLVVPTCVPLDHPLARDRDFSGKTGKFCSSKDLRTIMSWIGKRHKIKLLHLASKDGFSASSFHANCNNKGPTLTFVTANASGTGKGFTAGGYAPVAWTGNGSYVNNSSTFLFCVDPSNGQGLTQFKVSSTAHSMYDMSSYGPTFGSGHDLYLCDNCNTQASSYSNFPNGFQGTGASNTLFFGAYNFKVIDFAVFALL